MGRGLLTLVVVHARLERLQQFGRDRLAGQSQAGHDRVGNQHIVYPGIIASLQLAALARVKCMDAVAELARAD